jgi:hypothetical protein
MPTRRTATPQRKMTSRFVICVKNDGYEVSLEKRKIYRVVPDAKASGHNLLRVVDESGEDYLYPMEFFVPIRLPERAKPAFVVAI